MTLWTVLEHIVEPRSFLQSIRRLLAPDAVLLVLVPNVDSLAVRMLHEKAVTFAGDSHVNHFSPAHSGGCWNRVPPFPRSIVKRS